MTLLAALINAAVDCLWMAIVWAGYGESAPAVAPEVAASVALCRADFAAYLAGEMSHAEFVARRDF